MGLHNGWIVRWCQFTVNILIQQQNSPLPRTCWALSCVARVIKIPQANHPKTCLEGRKIKQPPTTKMVGL